MGLMNGLSTCHAASSAGVGFGVIGVSLDWRRRVGERSVRPHPIGDDVDDTRRLLPDRARANLKMTFGVVITHRSIWTRRDEAIPLLSRRKAREPGRDTHCTRQIRQFHDAVD